MLSVALTLLSLAHAQPPASATPDTVRQRHVTLAGWDRRVRTATWDRTGAYGGAYHDRGVLRRWTPEMDHEYDLDAWAILPSLADDAAFEQAASGLRMSTGSINTTQFVVESELRAGARVAGPLHVDARFLQQEDLSARRGAVELGYRVDLGRGHAVGLRHSIAEDKTDLDFDVFYRYRRDALTDVEVSAGRLDGLNNLVNAVLVPFPSHADTLRVYDTTPVWLTARGSLPVGRVRVEAAGGVEPRARATVRSQTTGDPGFALLDAVAYAGALAEATVWGSDRSDRLVVGAEARAVRSATGRRSAAGSDTPADYDARQTEGRLGVFALSRWRSVRAEGWLAVERRTDRQTGTAFGGSAVDGPYDVRERWTWGRLRVDWAPGAERGPLVGGELVTAYRGFPVGADQDELSRVLVYYPTSDARRATLRLGYRFSPRAEVVFGGSVDVDRDQPSLYDGAYVRLRAVW